MEVALRVGQLDARAHEGREDGEVQIAAQDGRELYLSGGPDAQDEVDGVVAEAFKDDGGLRRLEHVGVLARYPEQDVADMLRLTAVADADRDGDADLAVVDGPVGDGFGDEVGVGNDVDDVVIGADPGAAGADVDDIAGGAADLDAVADADGLLKQQDEAGDEVGNGVLQAEADAEAERPAHDDQAVEIKPDRLQADGDAEGEDEIGDHPGDRELLGGLQRGVGEDASLQEAERQVRDGAQAEEEQNHLDHEGEGDGRLAQQEERQGQNGVEVGSKAADQPAIQAAEERDREQAEKDKGREGDPAAAHSPGHGHEEGS